MRFAQRASQALAVKTVQRGIQSDLRCPDEPFDRVNIASVSKESVEAITADDYIGPSPLLSSCV